MSRTSWYPITALLLLAACSDANTPTQPVAATPPDESQVDVWETNAAVDWDEVARNMVAQNRSNPFQAIRGYAVVTLAEYNAAIAAEKVQPAKGARPSMHAAIASAAVAALTYLYPASATSLGSELTDYLAERPLSGGVKEDVDAGYAIGREVAAQVVARAQGDHFFDAWTGTVPVGPGLWFSATPPIGAAFGQAKTYFLTSGDQFRPPQPPEFGSAEYLAALAEVRHFSDTRTFAQDSLAKYWNFPAGTYQPPGFWNEEATRLAEKYHLNERETAHMLALMNMVSFDAVVASHEAKYFYWYMRPSQADPLITLSVPLPNFPSYPSNHASISAGMARIIGDRFPAESRRLDGLAEEAALSRVLGGIHFRFDGDAGVELGRNVARWALAHDVKGHEPFPLQ
jgi:PAP2 superfamily protein